MPPKENSNDFKPYVPADKNIPELTFGPVVIGIILGIIFGAASLYLVLKIGMTVTASIPIAVISVTLFRSFTKMFKMRPRTILENNITQTTGSAGESLAFGIGVTMPAVMILGFDMELHTVMLVSVLGGLLGVLMMIPLRQVLIVKEHGKLLFPEGTACANVLEVGESGGTSAFTVFTGFFIGLIYKFSNVGLKLWNDYPGKFFDNYRGASLFGEISPELLGLGYLIGPGLGGITMAGGVLAYWILVPMFALIGDHLTAPLYPGTKLISAMDPDEIAKTYVLYIGAGAVAAGGLISVLQSLPMIVSSAVEGFKGISKGKGKKSNSRTSRDIPMSVVLVGILILVLAIWFAPGLHMNLVGAGMIVVFAFLFVTVSARLCGQIGSSSTPFSGMTVATLLVTSFVFLSLGWVEPQHRLVALCIAAIVCVAAANAGNTSQDLKTGFLVGATPRYQQIGLLLGVFSSAMVIGFTLKFLNDSNTYYSAKAVPVGAHYAKVAELPTANFDHVTIPKEARGTYHVLRVPDAPRTGDIEKLPPGKYLVANDGAIKYFEDPGINGVLTHTDDLDRDGNPKKRETFKAPKAVLMSLIIDGILSEKLPWGLVLLGACIAVMMELCGVASLPFAIGVYLPIGTVVPVFIGGLVRALVDRRHKKRNETVEGPDDTGPGQLYSSGLIAGGAIVGIGVGLINTIEIKGRLLKDILDMSETAVWGPIFKANWPACLMFGVLTLSLYFMATRRPETQKKAASGRKTK